MYNAYQHFVNCFGDNQQEFFTKMIGTYTQGYRHYHNLNHILDMLNNLESFLIKLDEKTGNYDFDALRKAIWFHDYVYSPSSKTNEEDSAEEALKYITQEFKSLPEFIKSMAHPNCYKYHVQKVTDLIIQTKQHLPPGNDRNATLIVDLDLYGLSTDKYDLNNQLIVKEYSSFVSESQFKEGRTKWLTSFLEREKIFHNPEFSTPEMEDAARNNMKRELASLI